MQTSVTTKSNATLTNEPNSEQPLPASATAPGQLRVIKRNGAVVGYDESKISVAITKAYLADRKSVV